MVARIKMIKTAPGSDNGAVTKEYGAGTEYTVSDDLAAAFIAGGEAVAVESPKVAPPVAPPPAQKPVVKMPEVSGNRK